MILVIYRMNERTWHLLKASDKEVFGPIDLETLRGWAADAKISPLDKISSDNRMSWQRAPMIAELQMDHAGADAGQLPLRADQRGDDPGIPRHRRDRRKRDDHQLPGQHGGEVVGPRMVPGQPASCAQRGHDLARHPKAGRRT
jgi:hypothetical protein